jgi:hypothetical protein
MTIAVKMEVELEWDDIADVVEEAIKDHLEKQGVNIFMRQISISVEDEDGIRHSGNIRKAEFKIQGDNGV